MSVEYRAIYTGQEELKHYGILGQKWGIRRFQNADGTLTEEGRARYGRGNGKQKFIKDAIKDMDKSPKAYKEKVKAWGKTAEEAKVLDPNDPLSIYDVSHSRDQTRILSDIYDEMPSVKAKNDKKYTELAKHWDENADGFRKDKINKLDEIIKENEQDFSDRLGTKSVKETREYLMNSVKAFNELDYDEVIFQQMDDAPIAFDKGYLDVKTFSKLYDAQVADDAIDYAGEYDLDWIKDYHDAYDRSLKNTSQEDRLNKMFGKSDEVKHYDKDLNFVYYAYE